MSPRMMDMGPLHQSGSMGHGSLSRDFMCQMRHFVGVVPCHSLTHDGQEATVVAPFHD